MYGGAVKPADDAWPPGRRAPDAEAVGWLAVKPADALGAFFGTGLRVKTTIFSLGSSSSLCFGATVQAGAGGGGGGGGGGGSGGCALAVGA